MKVNSVIVDDDAFARMDLKKLLQEHFSDDIEVMADFDDPENAIKFIHDNNVKLVFLDIQMPGMNGFEML